ncbi:membrane lipoprotein lipid attachment site-containing protein [Cohnella thailandensis]|uniref:Membrane lipoprotein lipid attachment site-containing protein n=1 Tax=Cohnella thailandensis TaxID=557557 RepID=A0A841SRG3_9BACL|nr:membrane lipoprotein lipid attachment site-containing protein [Cohnella thailandensis]MBB6632758.1 membrane lipoprotein lipid attachment site-containing protein [Cohnella thailandensis]MBP1975553.1 putative lipoprotein NlpE involved in copper resistance [Cohnella thailandensis]
MKKFIVLSLLAILVLAGCSSKSEESIIALDDYIKAYSDQGIPVDPEEKPMYEMAQAINGVIFYIDNSPVKIYEYESNKDRKNAVSNDPTMKDWPSSGRFILETNSQKAKEIFESVK